MVEATRQDGQARVFYAPPGHRRLTINLSEDIHKKLKHAAVSQDTTATAIIEELLARPDLTTPTSEEQPMPEAIEGATARISTLVDGTLRVTIDIEPRDAQAAFRLFGTPGTAVALAALNPQAQETAE